MTRSNQFSSVLICLITAALIYHSAAGQATEPDAARQRTVAFVAEMAPPDLSTLAARATGEGEWANQMERVQSVLGDLVYLRENPDPEAFDVLAEVVDRVGGLYYYYALQAIYTLGTPKATVFLEEQMLAEDFNTRIGSMLLHSRGMESRAAADMFNRYVLLPSGDGLEAGLSLVSLDAETGEGMLSLSITNHTDQRLLFSGWPQFIEAWVYVRVPGGQVYRFHRIGSVFGPDDSPRTRNPGFDTNRTYTFELAFEPRRAEDGSYRLVCGSAQYNLPGPGDYEFLLIRGFQKPSPEALSAFVPLVDGEAWWSGRLISNSIRVTLPEVE